MKSLRSGYGALADHLRLVMMSYMGIYGELMMPYKAVMVR